MSVILHGGHHGGTLLRSYSWLQVTNRGGLSANSWLGWLTHPSPTREPTRTRTVHNRHRPCMNHVMHPLLMAGCEISTEFWGISGVISAYFTRCLHGRVTGVIDGWRGHMAHFWVSEKRYSSRRLPLFKVLLRSLIVPSSTSQRILGLRFRNTSRVEGSCGTRPLTHSVEDVDIRSNVVAENQISDTLF